MQTIIRPSLYGLGLTILWVGLASANPTITYHLAPALVAIAAPVGAALNGRLKPPTAVAASAIGLVLTYGATVGLGVTDRLTGPSLLPSGGAVVEAFVFGAIGAVAGFVFAIWPRR